MQNRYAGDVGDFMKFGLLRQLGASGLTIGLNWYLAPDESHNGDGKHVAYLEPSNRRHLSLRTCDPDLMARLARVVSTERSVAALNTCGALPPGSRVYSHPLEGSAGRRAWHRRALDALAGAEVVCTDPDNGIRSTGTPAKLHKYALLDELADYARRAQSLVAYQHADRSTDARTQAAHRLLELAAAVGQTPVGAVIARRGSCRFFLVTAADAHRERLAGALRAFAARWAPHVELA